MKNKKFRTVFFLSLIILILSNSLFPKTNRTSKFNKSNLSSTYMAYYMVGGHRMIIKNQLNSHLHQAGHPALSTTFLTMGGGGLIGGPNLMIGGEGFSYFSREKNSSSQRISVDAGYGFFNMAYQIYLKKKTRLFPIIGIGRGGIKISLADNTKPSSFDSLIENPDRGVTISKNGMIFQLALQTNFLLLEVNTLEFGSDNNSNLREYFIYRFMFGIRAGYIFAPFENKWNVDDFKIPDGPEKHIAGPYIQLQFGIHYDNHVLRNSIRTIFEN